MGCKGEGEGEEDWGVSQGSHIINKLVAGENAAKEVNQRYALDSH